MKIEEERQKFGTLTADQALKRLSKTFKKKKNIYLFDEDINAFNSLIRYVKGQQAIPMKRNALFAKMFIMVYDMLLKHHKTDIFADDEPRRALWRLLNKPMAVVVKEFYNELNLDDMARRVEAIDPEWGTHPALTTDAWNKKYLENFDNLPEEEQRAFFRKAFDQETVSVYLNEIINQALNICGND